VLSGLIYCTEYALGWLLVIVQADSSLNTWMPDGSGMRGIGTPSPETRGEFGRSFDEFALEHERGGVPCQKR
jgi:hypothetical protein